jgi:hypothetical protein
MDNTLQINSLKQWLAIKSIELGVAQIRQIDTDISTKNDKSGMLVMSVYGIDHSLTPTLRDSIYYYTSAENWTTITNLITDITKTFTWEAERFDCDKRSTLAASLVALLFRLNTCCRVYCKITNINTGNSDFHYPNIFVDDLGVAYLWDLDQQGLVQKITGQDMVAGVWKYHFLAVETI